MAQQLLLLTCKAPWPVRDPDQITRGQTVPLYLRGLPKGSAACTHNLLDLCLLKCLLDREHWEFSCSVTLETQWVT